MYYTRVHPWNESLNSQMKTNSEFAQILIGRENVHSTKITTLTLDSIYLEYAITISAYCTLYHICTMQ